MKRVLLAVVVSLALAGCGSNYAVRASTGGQMIVPAAAGSTVTTGPAGLYVSIGIGAFAGEVLAWMTGLAIYGAMLADEQRFTAPVGAPMREDRTVVEVDCTKPLPADLVGNLKCKPGR
jgi:hypothetical protein